MVSPQWATDGRTSAPHYQGQVYDEATGDTVAVTYHDENGDKARLAAAAPDLLASSLAVLSLLESEGRDTGTGGPLSDLRDAIAKATQG